MPDHFELLGLPRGFALDAALIERNYLARSREVHPDFHQLGSPAEQRQSMEAAAALNDAYATLRDPFRRAEYLLALEGGPTAAQHKEMSPEFLEEMLDLRTDIEELRETGAPESPGRRAMEERLNRRKDALTKHIGDCFAQPQSPETLLQVRKLLNAARYIGGLLRDLKAD